MRWFWVDRFEKFVAGKQAVTIKNVTLAEEPLDDYLPGHPHYSHSLIIEGMAQTGGLLISQMGGFQERVVLAKVTKADFHFVAEPGDQLRLTATLMGRQPDGAFIEGLVEVNGRCQAEMELTFAILDESYGKESFFIPRDLLRILRAMKLFDVARTESGERVGPPAHMLEDERQYLAANPL